MDSNAAEEGFRYAALQSDQAEIRRREEEKAIWEAAAALKKKISEARDEIVTVERTLQELKEEECNIRAQHDDTESSGGGSGIRSCSPARFRLGKASSTKKRSAMIERLENLRSEIQDEECRLETARSCLNAAASEEARVNHLLAANAERKTLLQRLSTLQEGSPQNMQVHLPSSAASTAIHFENVAVPRPQSPVVLRVKSVAHNTSKVIPNDHHQGSTFSDSIVESVQDRSPTVSEIPPELEGTKTIPAYADRHEDRKDVLPAKRLPPGNCDNGFDGDGLISFQLSSDNSVDDLMSSLSATEGDISLTSTVNSGYSPRRHRQGLVDVFRSRKGSLVSRPQLSKGDVEAEQFCIHLPTVSDDEPSIQALWLSHGSGACLPIDDNGLSRSYVGQHELQLTASHRSQRKEAIHQLDHDFAESALSSSKDNFVHNLYTRAVSAELENLALRRRIETLEVQCNVLRASRISANKMDEVPSAKADRFDSLIYLGQDSRRFSSPNAESFNYERNNYLQITNNNGSLVGSKAESEIDSRPRIFWNAELRSDVGLLRQRVPGRDQCAAPEEPLYAPSFMTNERVQRVGCEGSGRYYANEIGYAALHTELWAQEPAEPLHYPSSPSLNFSTGSAGSSDGISSCSTLQNSQRYESHCKMAVIEEQTACRLYGGEGKLNSVVGQIDKFPGTSESICSPEAKLLQGVQYFVGPKALEESIYDKAGHFDNRLVSTWRRGVGEQAHTSFYMLV